MPRPIWVSSIFLSRAYFLDTIVDVKRNCFSQDHALILWVYTIFSLLLRGGCFGILCLACWWEFLEDPSFPFLGCLHPQVSLHKAVGYSWQEEGGQPGTESFRAVREVWWGADPSPAPGLVSHSLSSSPPRTQCCCPLFPPHPHGCSPSAIYHFSSSIYGQREVFLIYENVFTVLSWKLCCMLAGKRNFGKSAGKHPLYTPGARESDTSPGAQCHTNSWRPQSHQHPAPPLPHQEWLSTHTKQPLHSELIPAPRKGTKVYGSSLCPTGPGSVLYPQQGREVRMLPRQEGVKRPICLAKELHLQEKVKALNLRGPLEAFPKTRDFRPSLLCWRAAGGKGSGPRLGPVGNEFLVRDWVF